MAEETQRRDQEQKREQGRPRKYRTEYAITAHSTPPAEPGQWNDVMPPAPRRGDSGVPWTPTTCTAGGAGYVVILWAREVAEL